jgi:hypothetical protein
MSIRRSLPQPTDTAVIVVSSFGCLDASKNLASGAEATSAEGLLVAALTRTSFFVLTDHTGGPLLPPVPVCSESVT